MKSIRKKITKSMRNFQLSFGLLPKYYFILDLFRLLALTYYELKKRRNKIIPVLIPLHFLLIVKIFRNKMNYEVSSM